MQKKYEPKLKVGDEIIVQIASRTTVIDEGAIGYVSKYHGLGPLTGEHLYDVDFGEPFGVVLVYEVEAELLSIVKSPLYKALL